jgi:hypothetical protein
MALYAFDGTWNKPDTDADDIDKNTNVYNFLRFYAPDDRESGAKIDEYQAGIGTRLGFPGRIVGGFFGGGGRTRVAEMVDSFAENWKRNGREDRVVDVIGFSRGAALAVHFCNVLARGVAIGPDKIRPPIRFLGLWDVVPSFGLPGVALPIAHNINIGWSLGVPGTVQNCRHAMALDERRGAFDVHRLDTTHEREPHVQEWWFRGVHSDVGGGNGNVRRGNISLVWMIEQARTCGLPLAAEEAARLPRNNAAPISYSTRQGRAGDRTIYEGDRFFPGEFRAMRVGETVQFAVDAQRWFNFSGILVQRSEQYLLTPDPAGKWNDASIPCDASGWPEHLRRSSGMGRLRAAFLRALPGRVRRVPAANWFEMVVCVGTSTKTAAPIGRRQHASSSWTAPAGGPLCFFANDSRTSPLGRDRYSTNSGSIAVTVKRER